MNYEELKRESERLLFSPEFRELTARLEFQEANVWEILHISRKENLVTLFLAWLLNPQGPHSFSDRFLKLFLVEALRTERGQESQLSPVEIAVMDLSGTIVQAESWLETRRCDIVIACEEKGLLCLVENKVGAQEGIDQTKDYHHESLTRYPEKNYPKRIYIYLSPDGSAPQSDHFVYVPYMSVLQAVRAQRNDRQNTETESFLLKQFQESLRRSVAMDKETLDLAQAIYEKYGSVIEFIYSNSEHGEIEDGPEATWDGKSWFFNIGEVGDNPYSWEDCKKYSFICAGGGERYQRIMERFKEGDVVYAYVSGYGYVGIGRITKKAVPFRFAKLADEVTKLIDLKKAGKLKGNYQSYEDVDWIALVDWEKAVDKKNAVKALPVTSSTAARIYDTRKELVTKVRKNLR